MIRSIIGWSMQLRLLMVAAAAVLIFFGATELRRMPIDVVPEFSPTQRRIVPAADVPRHKKHWLKSPLHSDEKTATE